MATEATRLLAEGAVPLAILGAEDVIPRPTSITATEGREQAIDTPRPLLATTRLAAIGTRETNVNGVLFPPVLAEVQTQTPRAEVPGRVTRVAVKTCFPSLCDYFEFASSFRYPLKSYRSYWLQ